MSKQGGGGAPPSGTTIVAETGLAAMVDHVVSVLLMDGRIIVGLLRGFDQAVNLILTDAKERVYSSKAGVEVVPLGLYMVRGDNVAVVGLVEEDIDMSIDFSEVRAAPLKAIKH